MDDDKTGLNVLIAHRHLRPSYARMISWEFSRAEDNQNESGAQRRKSKKDKRKERKVSEVDDENNDDSDLRHNLKDQSKSDISSEASGSDSEYVTADEDSLVNSLSSESDDNTDSVFESSFSTCLTSSGKETNYADEQPVDGATVTVRKRAPSKKQKKKRRKLVKKSYFLEDLPFAGTQFEDVDNDSNQKMHIQKNVPSLVEFCIRAMRRGSSKNQVSKTLTPYGVKSQLSTSHAKFSMVKYQLSWFYQLLSHFEPEHSFSDSCMYSTSNRNGKLKIPMRNIWNSCQDVTKWTLHRYASEYRGHFRSCYLAFAHIVNKENAPTTENDNPVPQIMSVLGSTIDLMLSSAIHLPKKKVKTSHFCDEDELLSSLTKTSVSRVKDVMSKRFPNITKHLFDRVLPYVFWARGDIKNTVQSFQECIAKQSSVRQKALYTSEIGRVYAMFDEPQKASSYFADAAEMLLEKNNYQKAEITKQVEHQTQLLKASVYDQGFMSSSKAEMSASAWKACVNSEQKPKDFEHFDNIFAIDAFLCFHSGTWKNASRTWLEEAKNMLTLLSPKQPELYFYLSMVHALEGNAKESKKTYRGFTLSVREASSPGQNVKACSPNSTMPWEDLAKLVCKHGIPNPLPVLWRTQFTPPRFHIKTQDQSTDIYDPDYDKLDAMEVKPRDADVSSLELNLRMTENGYITGDLQLLLPPIRGIYMNPYTGSLTFPQIPGDTENWQSVRFLNTHKIDNYCIKENCTSFVPVMTDIYHDSTGVKVQLLSPSLRLLVLRPKTAPILHLIWSGPRAGQKAKINLVTKIRDYIYQDLKTTISNEKTSDHDKKRMQELLKMSYNKGWRMMQINKTNPIWHHVDIENNEAKKLEKQQKTRTAKSKTKFVDNPFSLVIQEKPFVFGKTIFLSLEMDGTHIFVFVNCSTKEEFMHPVIKIGKSKIIVPVSEYNSLNWKNAEIFYVQLDTCICIYDRYGDDFDRIDLSLLHNVHVDRHRPVVIRSSLYAISNNQSLYCTCNTNQRWAEYLGVLQGLDVVGELLVVITEDGYIKFVENTCLMTVGIETESNSSHSVPLEDNALHFQEEKFQYFKVIGEKCFEDSSKTQFLRAAIAVDNHLIVVKTNPRIWKTGQEFEEADTVKVTSSIALSGQPREICFISEIVGYFVSVTQHVTTKWNYRENLYHFDHEGKLLGILPCLGPGPRSFLPLYLTGDPDLEPENKEMIKMGWHIYMRDGHDGIMCVRL